MDKEISLCPECGYRSQNKPCSQCDAFTEAAARIPEKHWAKNDLSAVRLGWNLAQQAQQPNAEAHAPGEARSQGGMK